MKKEEKVAYNNVDLSGRIALVTGASRGIGAAIAKAYAQAGAHTILVARTLGGLEEVYDDIHEEGGSATLMPMDLLKMEDIDLLGPSIASRFGRLDIFIGNAAMLGELTPLAHITAKEWQKVLDLNLTANFRLLRTLDPLLRHSDAGRIVFVTSDLATKGHAYWGLYGVSKAALEMLARTYAAEVENTNVRVNLVVPGAVRTAMLDEAYPGGYQGSTLEPEDIIGVFLELASPHCTDNGKRLSVPVSAAAKEQQE